MATDFLSYRIDNAFMESNPPIKIPGMSYRVGLRHVHALYLAASLAVLGWARLAPALATVAVALQPLTGALDHNRNGSHSHAAPMHGWSGWEQGVFLASFHFGRAAVPWAAARVVRWAGGKHLLVFALLVHGALLIALPALARIGGGGGGGWGAACGARAFMGAAHAAVRPATRTMLANWMPPHERTSAGCFVYAGVQVGTVLAVASAGPLASSAPGWPLLLYVPGILALASAVVLLTLASDSPARHHAVPDKEKDYILAHNHTYPEARCRVPWRVVVRCRAVWAVCGAQFGCHLLYWLLLYLALPYLAQVLQFTFTQSAWVLTLSLAVGWWVAAALSAALPAMRRSGLLALLLGIRFSSRQLNFIGAAGASLSASVLVLLGGQWRPLAVTLTAMTLAFSALQVVGVVEYVAELPLPLGARVGPALDLVTDLAGVLLPLAAGLVLDAHEVREERWRALVLSVAGLSVVCALPLPSRSPGPGSDDTQPWDHYFADAGDEPDAERSVYELQKLKSSKEFTSNS